MSLVSSGSFSTAFSFAFDRFVEFPASGTLDTPLLREYIVQRKRDSIYHKFYVDYNG